MVDLTNNPLVNGYLSFGQFDLFESSSFLRRKRSFVNRLIKLLIFVDILKFIVILLDEWWFRLNLKVYLIEIYLFDPDQQKLLDPGLLFVHIGFCVGFLIWISLNEKVSSLESFRFLLFHHSKDHYRYRQFYHLDRRSTDKFFTAYCLACLFFRPLVAVFCFSIWVAILRCLYESFYRVGLLYFLSISLLLSVITAFNYLLMVIFEFSKIILLFLSTEFFIFRVKAINSLICERFMRVEHPFIRRPMKFRKQKSTARKILHLLNHFCRQFEEVNSVLDSSLSPALLGAFMFMFVIPYFLVFVETALGIRLLLSTMVVAVYLICSLISICNDRLNRQINTLVNTILFVQPLFRSASTKLAFNNFLLMNSEHQTSLSLTLFGLPYDSNTILEYTFHSISMVLLLYQTYNL